MGSEWKEKIISEVVILIGGGTPKRSVPEYWNGNVPWLSVKDFNNGYRHVGYAEESITELGVKKSSTRILQTGQLIISARGTVGALAQLALPMAFNQSCYGIDAKPEYTINDFLYYMIKYSISNIKKLTHGAVFDTITRNTFDYIKVQLPPLSEQKTIAHILGSLDDKIDLNRKMNSTLESMAQALFKSWFVDFDPVIDKALAAGNPIPEPLQKRAEIRRQLGNKRKALPADIEKHFPSSFAFSEELGWIPKGWEVIQLKEIAKFANGRTSPERGCGNISVFGSNGCIGFSTDYNRDDVIVIGRVGTYCGSLHYCRSRCWVTDNAITAEMQKKDNNTYLLQLLKQCNLNDMQSGSGQPLINQTILGSIKSVNPPDNIISQFTKYLYQYYKRIDFNNQAISHTSSLRDTLLPKLISGELRVPEVEKLVEEAL